MANEIIGLTRDRHRRSSQFLFLYTIDQAETVGAGGPAVVVTPSANLPPLIAVLVPVGVKANLDTGAMAFAVVDVEEPDGLTNPQKVQLVQGVYAKHLAAFLGEYHARYSFTGRTINAP